MTKGSPARVQHAPGTGLTYCRKCYPSSCSGDRTALNRATYTPRAPHTVKRLLQVHKTHVDWSGKLPRILEHPSEGIELVQFSRARTKTALFLLNQKLYHRLDAPLQYPGIDFSGEAEECDPPIVGTHPPVPLLKKGDHHPFCPVQKHCPRPPRDVTEACQPRQPHHIQRLEVLREDLIHNIDNIAWMPCPCGAYKLPKWLQLG